MITKHSFKYLHLMLIFHFITQLWVDSIKHKSVNAAFAAWKDYNIINLYE